MNGEKIQYNEDGKLHVPDRPIIPYIEGMEWDRISGGPPYESLMPP
jgi:isocitrate dehydrogenase